MGLALVKALAELHGGGAVAESEGPGRGSVFAVTLPLASGDTVARSSRR
jgi:signal transduction histidine kinase